MTIQLQPAIPTKLFVSITNACNVKCKHCMPDSAVAMSDELSSDEINGLLNQAHATGVRRVAFTGGEATLRRDLDDIVSHAASLDFRVDLETSASLYRPGKIAKLASNGLKVLCLSLDGADSEQHDKFRGVPGLFERVLSAAAEALSCGLEVRIFCSVSTENIHNALKLVDVLEQRDLRVQGLTFAPVTPIGRAGENLGLTLTPDEWIAFHDDFEAKRHTTRIPMRIERMFIKKDELSVFRALFPQDFSCIARERRYCYVNPQGFAYGCSLLTGTGHHLGNIRASSLKDIWLHSISWNFFGEKPETDDEIVASCNKGCPALTRANSIDGNNFKHQHLAEDTIPICPMVQTPQIDKWPTRVAQAAH